MLCLFGIQLQAQQLTYYDASCFPLLGKATQDTGARYERLPDSLKNISRSPLWNLSRNSAGMAIRFRSNSTRIALKWENLFNNHMNHMTDTGVKGLDLYCWESNGKWRFVNSARPNGKTNQATIIANMQPQEREYMLYLPLYDGLVSLSTLNPQLHSRSATYKRNGLLIRKTAIKSSRPFQCAYYPLTP